MAQVGLEEAAALAGQTHPGEHLDALAAQVDDLVEATGQPNTWLRLM